MLPILYTLIHAIQPLLVPICLISAWGLITLAALNLWATARDSVKVAKQMHQIPCTGCQYFTADFRLKCTVRPSIANTEEAINCMDYQPKTNSMFY